jgi:hypothetical protein
VFGSKLTKVYTIDNRVDRTAHLNETTTGANGLYYPLSDNISIVPLHLNNQRTSLGDFIRPAGSEPIGIGLNYQF